MSFNMKSPKTSQSGFSLVEMIVSLGVFSVVITIAVGALLTMIASNNQLQAEQSVMTNLSFALDSMTREIRTGSHYYCYSAGSDNNNIFDSGEDQDSILNINDFNDCATGRPVGQKFQGISFVEGGNSITGTINKRILYYYSKNDEVIYRRVGALSAQPITSSGIVIDAAEFYVTGSEPQSDGGNDQPTVTIFMEAHDANDTSANPKKYRLQTTITQRALDI